jgi:hypothetical protein
VYYNNINIYLGALMMNIGIIKNLFSDEKIKWSTHCLERMQEISVIDYSKSA